MGVEFYNCCICNDIYADCGEYGNCEGCGQSWCGRCDKTQNVFWYDGSIRCTLCFSTDPKPIEDNDLLEYALEKLNKSRAELIDDLKRDRPEYTEPQCVYECQEDPDLHICNKKCTTLDEDFSDEDLKQYATHQVRGRCCNFKYPDDPDKKCNACYGKRKKM